MKDFAPESYYDEAIAKAKALGYRFVAKVVISTDDMPYHVQCDAARATCITLDIPGKALFVNLYHHELTGFLDDGYDNHWSVKFEFDLGDYGALLPKLQKQKGWQELEDIFKPVNDSLEEPIDNLQDGWWGCCDLCCTFTGDIFNQDNKLLSSLCFVESVLSQILIKRSTCYAVPKFKELLIHWEPEYVFASENRQLTAATRNINWQEQEERKKKLSNIYWERFGDGRKVIREKVGRTY